MCSTYLQDAREFFGGRCNIVITAGTCIRGAEFDPGLVMDFKERGVHSGRPFLVVNHRPNLLTR